MYGIDSALLKSLEYECIGWTIALWTRNLQLECCNLSRPLNLRAPEPILVIGPLNAGRLVFSFWFNALIWLSKSLMPSTVLHIFVLAPSKCTPSRVQETKAKRKFSKPLAIKFGEFPRCACQRRTPWSINFLESFMASVSQIGIFWAWNVVLLLFVLCCCPYFKYAF